VPGGRAVISLDAEAAAYATDPDFERVLVYIGAMTSSAGISAGRTAGAGAAGCGAGLAGRGCWGSSARLGLRGRVSAGVGLPGGFGGVRAV
jgi:hypothetical protein